MPAFSWIRPEPWGLHVVPADCWIDPARPVEQALDQLSLRYGHVAAARTGILDAFFRAYAGFVKEKGPKPFLDWVRDDYSEDALRAEFRSTPWADRLVDGVLRRE